MTATPQHHVWRSNGAMPIPDHFLVQISLCGDFLPWLHVHARIDEEWSRTRSLFITAVTCGRDLCMQVAMQTDTYINTTRCVGIAATPTHACVIIQILLWVAFLLFREAHVSAREVCCLEAFLSRCWDTTASSLIHITSSFLIILQFVF